LAFALSGCPQNLSRPTAAPLGDQAPVSLRQLQILQTADGHRAVLLRLSRVPGMLRHSSERDPGRIQVEAWGPLGDGDLDERALPQTDPEITDVRVSRHEGTLRITIGFRFDDPPPYSVHEMGDWVMIRLNPSGQG